MGNCPVCGLRLNSNCKYPGEHILYECKKCGNFKLTEATQMYLLNLNLPENEKKQKMTLITHYISEYNYYTTGHDILILEKNFIENEIFKMQFPTPVEQINNFILVLGNETKTAGKYITISNNQPDIYYKVLVKTYCLDDNNLIFLLNSAKNFDLISSLTNYSHSLTLKGWEKYEELKKEKQNSKKAFMAMQFSNEDLTKFFKEFIQPEIKKTGFDIFRLDDKPEHGLIDDRLRVEIRNSRFLIVDLTDQNNGAYWEAGYAEALGKKVFYICNKKAFNENKEAMKIDDKIKSLVHFDTEHQQIYFWDNDNNEKFLDDLKYSIRLAFPDAIQEDKK